MGEEGEEGDQINPLIEVEPSSPQSPAFNSHHKRTGTVWTAVSLIITTVIGSGVLSLAWSVAQLGWIGGPLAMLGFAGITYLSSSLLSDCYRSPDPDHGPIRNITYMDAVGVNLGKKSTWFCGVMQQVSFMGTAIAYVITSSTCMRFLWKKQARPID